MLQNNEKMFVLVRLLFVSSSDCVVHNNCYLCPIIFTLLVTDSVSATRILTKHSVNKVKNLFDHYFFPQNFSTYHENIVIVHFI